MIESVSLFLNNMHWSQFLYVFAFAVSCVRFLFNKKETILFVSGLFFLMNSVYFGVNEATAGCVLCLVSFVFSWGMIFFKDISTITQLMIAFSAYSFALWFYGFEWISVLPALGFMLGRFAEMSSSVFKYWLLDISTVACFLGYMFLLNLWFAFVLTGIQLLFTLIHVYIKNNVIQNKTAVPDITEPAAI